MNEQDLDPKLATFVERLAKLDAGERARLKRNAGQKLAESRGVMGMFYHLLPPGVSEYQHEAYFMLATLYPLADGGGQGNLGDALRLARQAKNAKGVDRRVEILLDADDAQLPFRLRQAIRFLKSNNVRVNWPRLLADLLRWAHPNRFVQQQWARSYFAE